MRDATDLIKLIKKITLEAVESAKPTALVYGKVSQESPLEISLEQKLTLTTAQLVLSRNVTEFQHEMTLDHRTEEDIHSHTTPEGECSEEAHSHGYLGKKVFLVHHQLTLGEEVLLLRMQGGQKYLVLDRVVSL